MKLAFAFAVAMAAATPTLAADLPMPGLSLDTEVKLDRAYDAEATTLTINPEVNWNPMVDGPLTLSLGTTVTAFDSTVGSTFADDFILFDNTTDGSRPDIELGATYLVREGLEFYGETSWDTNENERGEINFGATFNF
jgi:hypothetical protein